MIDTTTQDAFNPSGGIPLAMGPAAAPPPAASDRSLVERIDEQLDQLEKLTRMLADDDSYADSLDDLDPPADFKLSVVMPVYNEQDTICRILARVRALPLAKEIVVVDDCSTDRTRDILSSLAAAPGLRVIYKPRNEGKGAALRTGLAEADGDIVVIQDADLEYDPRDIPQLIGPILRGRADVVYGSRFLGPRPRDPSFLHRFGNGLLTRASNWTTGLRLTDMETCYKAFRRDLLGYVELKQRRFGFEPEITAKLARLGCRFEERPIRYEARSYAQGKKIGLKDAMNALYCIARYALVD